MKARVNEALYQQAKKNFKQLDMDFEKEFVKSMKRAGNIVAQEARSNAPEDTGEGKKTIRARKTKKKNDYQKSVAIGPDTAHKYMLMPEFGTEDQEKQWFVHGALESKENEVIQSIENNLRKVIK